jgi:hypothetical protein
MARAAIDFERVEAVLDEGLGFGRTAVSGKEAPIL